MNEWMNELMNEWMNEWIDKWIFDSLLMKNLFFYSGTFVPEKDCTIVPCKNGGSCVNDPKKENMKYCKCPEFFIGKRCETDAGKLHFYIIQKYCVFSWH